MVATTPLGGACAEAETPARASTTAAQSIAPLVNIVLGFFRIHHSALCPARSCPGCWPRCGPHLLAEGWAKTGGCYSQCSVTVTWLAPVFAVSFQPIATASPAFRLCVWVVSMFAALVPFTVTWVVIEVGLPLT